MKKIRVAHLGIAHDHSIFAMGSIRRLPDLFELVGVCEPDEADRLRFGGHDVYRDVPWLTEEELFARQDIDAVLCEGHELRSVAQAQKCIDHGLHVHLDKPGGTDLAAFTHLLQSAQAKGLTVQMGYMYRWNPAFRYVLNAVKSGRLGDISGIDASFSVQHSPEKRRWLAQFPGGMMFFLGCHSLDMILQLMGEPTHTASFHHSADSESGGALDSCLSVLDYPGCACTIRVNASEPNGYHRRQLKVCGTKGTIDIQPLENPTIVRETDAADGWANPWRDYSKSVWPGGLADRYDCMMLDLAAFVRGEKQNPYTPEYEIMLQRILLDLCQS